MQPKQETNQEPTVLIDGAHFQKKTGTGILSYARTLAEGLKEAGCQLAVLFGERIQTSKKDHWLVGANQVFGHRPGESQYERFLRSVERYRNFVLLGLKAQLHQRQTIDATTVPLAGVDLSAMVPRPPAFDRMFNANGIYERADIFFRLTQRLTEVTLPAGIAAAHWTFPVPVRAKGIPNIYTIHDLIPLRYPYFVIDRGGNIVKLHSALARSADLIVTVSEASKREIVSLLGVPDEKVCVTYQPCPPLPEISRSDAERLVKTFYSVEPGEYALFLGAIEPKKNLQRIIEAYILSGLTIPLLIAGPLGWLYGEDMALIDAVAKAGAANAEAEAYDSPGPTKKKFSRVRHLGFIPRLHTVALLKCARFFVFPSVCEGFGLPVLEAMQVGVPVLTSNTSSLPEVAGEAAELVDPLSVGDIARGMRALAGDSDLRNELVHRGYLQAAKFSGEAYRRRLIDAYKKVGIEISPAHDL